MSGRAVVIDDDALSREYLVEALQTHGWTVYEASTGEAGVQEVSRTEAELVLTDLRLPGWDGVQVLERVRERHPDTAVVVLTAFGTVERAVEAMKAGATDFLLKPVSPEQLELILRRWTERKSLQRENRVLRATLTPAGVVRSDVIGENRSFRAVLALAERVARTDATVLVRGESGTGKELVADLLHRHGSRPTGPFIRVNCAALTESLLTSELFGHEKGAFTGAHQRKEGRFELACGGTLFLDEIGEIPPEVQVRLLRVLESREFERVGGTKTLRSEARIVAATNRDLEQAMKEGRFREDLYYRLNVVPLVLPPLRDRLDDIAALAQHFVDRFARNHGSPARRLSASSIQLLREADWPGNVRELANTIERACLVANHETLEPADLCLSPVQKESGSSLRVGMTLEECERELILSTLNSTGGNRTHAARLLGVTARTLSNKIRTWKALGIFEETTT